MAKEVVEYLAGREAPLTKTSKSGGGGGAMPKRGRKVSLGTIPDFSYKGDGFRLSGVVPGSPAEAGGLREGDIIVRIGSDDVHNLRGFSDILKSLDPGDRISLTIQREGKEMIVEAEVTGR